jgi:uncharacterized protein (TIGR02594 family)
MKSGHGRAHPRAISEEDREMLGIPTARRMFIKKFLWASIALGSEWCLGTEQHDSVASIPAGIGVKPDFAGVLPRGRLGTKHPLTPEEKIATAVLSRSPEGPSPVDVARYFLSVGEGKFQDDWRPYTSGWPERWNPVIVEFFRATNTLPNGDITPWCAAFVNWCFLRSQKAPATHSASSGSFRCFGAATEDPRPGDVVVFRKIGSTEKCQGRGHVGFFIADYGDEVEVLGGNQIEGHDKSHKISSKRLKKRGAVLVFDSYRRSAHT